MNVHERSHAHVCGMHRVLEAFVAAVTSAAAAQRHGRTARTDKERWSAAATGGWHSLSTDSCMTDILIYVNGQAAAGSA